MTQPSPRRTRATKTATKTTASRPRLPKAIQIAIEAALGKKAMDMVVLDLRKSDAFTDFFVIATGANPRQVHAIADGVEQALKIGHVRPSNVEYPARQWVLLDYFDFVVHVPAYGAPFHGLERLWATAASVEGRARVTASRPRRAQAAASTRVTLRAIANRALCAVPASWPPPAAGAPPARRRRLRHLLVVARYLQPAPVHTVRRTPALVARGHPGGPALPTLSPSSADDCARGRCGPLRRDTARRGPRAQVRRPPLGGAAAGRPDADGRP
jgi:ribosome silencing factor RsfS/YbeB/iojap